MFDSQKVKCFGLRDSEKSLAFPHLFCAEGGTVHFTDKPEVVKLITGPTWYMYPTHVYAQ